ncbi:MAG: transposase [Patescibacteria group bacterium]
MPYRKEELIKGERYHIYNRGVEQRSIFQDRHDLLRFLQCLEDFNEIEPSGGLYMQSFEKDLQLRHQVSKLVNIICYCLIPNHFHLMLEQVAEKGIEKFIHRVCNGYAKYFNHKYHRVGPLFQGPFKSSLIDDNEYLLRMSVYINLNYRVHRLPQNALYQSSWEQYLGKSNNLCDKKIITSQFKSLGEYNNFAEDMLPILVERKDDQKELGNIYFE